MSPRRKTIEEEHDVLATTHHNLSAVQEEMEDLNELTSATHREQPPSLTKEEEEPVTSPPPPPAAAAAADGKSKESEIDISLRIHEKVASLASKAYRKASAKSNVLCKDKISGVALVKFEDITVGQLLGKGSFSYVHEITKISSGAASHEAEDDDGDSNDYPVMHANKDQEDHRAFLVANAERRESKSFRYAVKFLKDDVRSNPKAYAIGTVDLVVEGMFLASLTHPNIIKVRALPEGGVRSLVQPNAKGYFLVLDRLYDTLSERIYNTWQEQHHVEMAMASSSGCLCLPFGKKNNQANEEERRHLEERLKVAFDISAALKFLHSKSIIYRDIKPENLGFDVRGDIKLFDLGLVKELHPNDRKRDGNYKLSMAGTPRYMAPECGKHLRYNLSADVYSFSMLLWEIVTMTQPLDDFTYPRLQKEVFEDGYRPPLTAVTNKSIKDLIRVGWHQDASKRPSMDTVYDELKKEFQILHGVKMSEKELSHDRRRSTHVPSRLANVNVSTLLRLSSDGNLGAVPNR